MWCKETKNVHISYKIVTKTGKCFVCSGATTCRHLASARFRPRSQTPKSSPRFVSKFNWHRTHRERETDRAGDGNKLESQKRRLEKSKLMEGRKRETVKWKVMRVEKLHDPPPPQPKQRNGERKKRGSVHIKKHKQILCSFITKYSATINIAFLSPFHFESDEVNFAFPALFSVLNTCCKYEAWTLVLSLSCATRSVLLSGRKTGFRFRDVNITQTLLETRQKKQQDEHKE